MLFQPTNITPSLLGELGNGTVDITDTSGLTVSWQVNGNSTMTKFQIDIYENTAASTLLYSTGVKTDGCPFSPTDASGNQQFFSYTIPHGTISDDFFAYTTASTTITSLQVDENTFKTQAGTRRGEFRFSRVLVGWYLEYGGSSTLVTMSDWGITYSGTAPQGTVIRVMYGAQNGTELKLKITQYWSSTDYVEQRSASAFITRTKPSLSVIDPSPVGISETIIGQYSQEQGDPMNWARWILVRGTDYDNPVVDTGNMYEATTLSLSYEGFINGETYAVKLMAETASGVAAETAWTTFTVTYPATSFSGDITAEPKKDKSGVLVKWAKPDYINGSYTGTAPTVTLKKCVIPASSSVYWDSVSGQSMNLGDACVAWRGSQVGNQGSIFELYNTANQGIVQVKATESGSEVQRCGGGGTLPIEFVCKGDDKVLLLPERSIRMYSEAYTTTDFMTFQHVSLPVGLWNGSVIGVAYGNGVYAILTEDFVYYTSDLTDRNSWTVKNNPASGQTFVAFLYNGSSSVQGSAFVVVSTAAVGSRTDTTIWYTTDFSSWNSKTLANTPATAATTMLGSINIAAKGFCMLSSGTDLTTWQTKAIPSAASSAIWSSGCAENGYVVFVGSNGTNGVFIKSANNGVTWTYGGILPVNQPTFVSGGVISGLAGVDTQIFVVQSRDEKKAVYSTGATMLTSWQQYSGEIAYQSASAFYGKTGAVFSDRVSERLLIKPSLTVSVVNGATTYITASNIFSTNDMLIIMSETEWLGRTSSCVEVVSYINRNDVVWNMSYGLSVLYTLTGIGKASLAGSQTCEYFVITRGKNLSEEQEKRLRKPNDYYPPYPVYNESSQLVANFINSNLEAGAISSLSTSAKVTIFRQEKGKDEYTKIGSFNAIGADATTSLIDCATPNQTTVRYAMCIGLSSGAIGLINSNYVKPLSWSWDLIACDIGADGFYHAQAVYRFIYNLSTGSIGNNGGNNLLSNFTRYPTVQYAPHNYASGTLSGLIGSVSKGAYTDSVSLKNAIYKLSDGYDALFLKSIKGEIWKIAVVGQITMTTSDATKEQAQTVSIPWAEVGSMDGVQVVIDEASDLWEG